MLLKALSRRCEGQGGKCSRPDGAAHGVTCGRTARDAAIYPQQLCRAVIKGARDQLFADGKLKRGCYGVQSADDEASIVEATYNETNGYSGKYCDDTSKQVLKDELVLAARRKELDYSNSKGV